jgi:hypothetical protein
VAEEDVRAGDDGPIRVYGMASILEGKDSIQMEGAL